MRQRGGVMMHDARELLRQGRGTVKCIMVLVNEKKKKKTKEK